MRICNRPDAGAVRDSEELCIKSGMPLTRGRATETVLMDRLLHHHWLRGP